MQPVRHGPLQCPAHLRSPPACTECMHDLKGDDSFARAPSNMTVVHVVHVENAESVAICSTEQWLTEENQQ